MRFNRFFDGDILSARCARLLSAGQLEVRVEHQ